MANIKGNNFNTQSRSVYFLLYAFGVQRHLNGESRKTHSVELCKKRDMYMRDFVSYLEGLGLEGKLNIYMGNYEVVKRFLLDRTSHLCKSSSSGLVSGFSSLFDGLLSENITIADSGFEAIEDIRAFVQEMPEDEFRTGRYIRNTKDVLGKLFDTRFESGVLAQIQNETGFRISEAYKLAESPEKYLIESNVVGLIGKSNHLYEPKQISRDLVIKISGLEKLPTRHTYSKHIKLATSNNESIPHDWRVTYVKEEFDKRIDRGMIREDALREVSKLVNHHRLEITEYYLLRA